MYGDFYYELLLASIALPVVTLHTLAHNSSLAPAGAQTRIRLCLLAVVLSVHLPVLRMSPGPFPLFVWRNVSVRPTTADTVTVANEQGELGHEPAV